MLFALQFGRRQNQTDMKAQQKFLSVSLSAMFFYVDVGNMSDNTKKNVNDIVGDEGGESSG